MTTALTIPALVIEAAGLWPQAEAIVDGPRRISFAELSDLMMAASAGFVAAGLSPGERVAIWAENSADWIIACLGLQAAGGVLVPLNTRFKQSEAEFILRRARCAFVVASEAFLGTRYADLVDAMDLPELRGVIRLGTPAWDDFLARTEQDVRADAARRLAGLGESDLSDIMFTSGTTGEPKGAMATHGQTVRTARLWGKAATVGAGDRFLILWPFFHCSGYKAGWVTNLAVGATTLPLAVLHTADLLATVEAEQVTILPGPPTLFQALLAMPDRPVASLNSVRVSVTGASSVAPSMIEAMRHVLEIPVVLTGYGLTETCGTVTMTSPDDAPELVTISCGKAIEGVEIACVDDEGRHLPPGEPGEVLVRGMNVMTGYLDDPQATADAIAPDGWLHTGDIGVLDEAGYLRITDRKKDIYIVGGFNCYPAEIEKALLGHPAVLQVAVTGMPDERLGEVGRAFVVVKQGAAIDGPELIAWSRDRMANYKVPREIRFVATLPTNATGKVQKFKLPA